MESKKNSREIVFTALRNVKGDIRDSSNEDLRIVQDLGFESIDIVDLLFEVEQLSGIVITMGDLSSHMKSQSGSRFQNLTVKNLISYIDEK